MTDLQLFWTLAIPTAMLTALVVGALCVEHLAPRARKSLRRIERHRAGRRAMARQHAEAQARLDEERRRASEWIASRCYFHQERQP